MGHEVKVRRREAALVVSKRVAVRMPEIGGVLGAAFGEVYGHLEAHGIRASEPPFVIYHGTPVADQPFDMEICAQVPAAVVPPAGWQLFELPAGTFATLLHVGPYETTGVAYAALTAWISEHGLVAAGPPREVYLSEPETPPEQVRTILELPVVEVPAPVATT